MITVGNAAKLANRGPIDYPEGVEDGLSPAFLSLAIDLDPDNERPTRPGLLYLKRDA
jgi:hypothetical protein